VPDILTGQGGGGGNAVALLTDNNARLVQIAGAVFTVICAMLY